jgi:hypothetical protein
MCTWTQSDVDQWVWRILRISAFRRLLRLSPLRGRSAVTGSLRTKWTRMTHQRRREALDAPAREQAHGAYRAVRTLE